MSGTLQERQKVRLTAQGMKEVFWCASDARCAMDSGHWRKTMYKAPVAGSAVQAAELRRTDWRRGIRFPLIALPAAAGLHRGRSCLRQGDAAPP